MPALEHDGTVITQSLAICEYLEERFPQSPLIGASAEERAERRYKQLKDKGVSVTLDGLLREILARDARDAQRTVAPLKPADDAVIIDTPGLGIEAVVERVLALVPVVAAAE